MRGTALKVLALVSALILAVAACGADPTPTPVPPTNAPPTATPVPPTETPPEPVRVVTGTVILADLARNVGGDAVDVESLIPSGGDAHTFRTTPSDGIKVGGADVILLNGSGLDDDLVAFVESSRRSGSIFIEVSEGLTPMELVVRELGDDPHDEEEEEGGDHGDEEEEEGEDHHDEEEEEGEDHGDEEEEEGEDHGDEEEEEGEDHGDEEEEEGDHGDEEEEEDDHGDEEEGHGHGGGDPHFWLDPIATIFYIERIRDALIEAAPANADTFRANADAYIQRLRDLDAEIRETLSVIPAEHRTLVSFHDAFGYFGARYDFEVVAFVGVHGGEPTPGDIAGVIHEVEEEGLPAIFGEPQFAEEALAAAAAEAGIEVGAVRSATFDDEVTDYISMMRANAEELARLLG